MLVYCVVCGFVAGWDATAKPCETVADAYCALPACEAWIVHVPAATSFAVARGAVHTAGGGGGEENRQAGIGFGAQLYGPARYLRGNRIERDGLLQRGLGRQKRQS